MFFQKSQKVCILTFFALFCPKPIVSPPTDRNLGQPELVPTTPTRTMSAQTMVVHVSSLY